MGNHEVAKGSVSGDYFKYFGANAGDPHKGYYSYDLGSWHLIALNANCGKFLFNYTPWNCASVSPQVRWLKQDLAANRGKCLLAYWHVPYYSSGINSLKNQAPAYRNFWQLLWSARADVVLSGHDHDYERFGKQDADGRADASGVAQFVAGTGGEELTAKITSPSNSKFFDNKHFGVLRMTLHDQSYEWQFMTTDHKVMDQGTAQCNMLREI